MNVRKLQSSARKQRGLFTRNQAIACGVPERTVAFHVAMSTWQEVAPGVFRALPAAPLTWRTRLAALALSVEGVAFGRSGLALYGLCEPPADIEVLVARPHRNRLDAAVHSTRSLPRSDIATIDGIRVTMPARTICDGAALLSFDQVCEVVDAAVVRKLVRPLGLARRASELRNSKRPGCRKVLEALAVQHPQLDRARNDWEALVLRLANEYELPRPIPNLWVDVAGQRRQLDAAWPDHHIDLEFDGFRTHMVRKTFDEDRVRQNQLVADGWRVFRATSFLLESNPDSVFSPLRELIGARGHESGSMLLVS